MLKRVTAYRVQGGGLYEIKEEAENVELKCEIIRTLGTMEGMEIDIPFNGNDLENDVTLQRLMAIGRAAEQIRKNKEIINQIKQRR